MKLTASQHRAINYTGRNLQLLACAGSGKTEVVARRVVHLLSPGHSDSLEPRNIVAFTFTEKAAAELKERILTRTEDQLGSVSGLAEMFIGTIHAFCLELIKTEVPKFLKYEVLNTVQQTLFVDRNSRQSGLTTSTTTTGTALKRYTDTNSFVSALSILRESRLVPARLRSCSVAQALAQYESLLERHSYLDYSSILAAADQTLREDASVREGIAARVRYVIVDEYQDVNPIQEQVVRTLHDLGAKVCVVGDDDQTIYQWRGSDVEHILTFEDRYPEVEQIPLAENFRSSLAIVDTARTFVEQNEKRLIKDMKAAGDQVYEPGDVVALHFSDPDAEAAHIVATARALRGVAFSEDGTERGLSWSDMAILLRSVKANAEPITRALKSAGIPFVVRGMTSLFETAEAEAARQLFYFMDSQRDITEASLKRVWLAADLGLAPAALDRAIAKLAEAKRTLKEKEQKRWSQYSIQRVFLSFLENAELREESIPKFSGGETLGERATIVFYNLGKFSQIISDFESIHFQSAPIEKYKSFASFLEHRASDIYPEGCQDNQYARPDAVEIMTIHQAKGMQWPVVFVPALLRNRFPARKPGGRTVWHLLPREGVEDQARYEGDIEDERRLFYVAITRSQKFLHLTWAPVSGNQQAQRKSEFWEDVLVSKQVKRTIPDYSSRRRSTPRAKPSVANVVFSFSDLKYFFECPYQFKLRVLYGFNAPIHEALGYGKSLHDALAEVHYRAMTGDVATSEEAARLVQDHLHAPYAYPALRSELEAAAERVVGTYLTDNTDELRNIEFSEKSISVNLGDGISVVGRIDLVRRIDSEETTIVDLKSSDRAQAEEVTEAQLHVYALGYQDLTGRNADYVEVYELDEGRRKPRSVDDELIENVKEGIQAAADALRLDMFRPDPATSKCGGCDYRGMCSAAV